MLSPNEQGQFNSDSFSITTSSGSAQARISGVTCPIESVLFFFLIRAQTWLGLVCLFCFHNKKLVSNEIKTYNNLIMRLNQFYPKAYIINQV